MSVGGCHSASGFDADRHRSAKARLGADLPEYLHLFGGTTNFDGSNLGGTHNASGNNSVFAYAWIAF